MVSGWNSPEERQQVVGVEGGEGSGSKGNQGY